MHDVLHDESTGEPFTVELFDIHGNPISISKWVSLFHRSVGLTDEVDGFLVMTRWTGVDSPDPTKTVREFSFKQWVPNDPPLIYNTIVLDADHKVVDSGQAATKQEAIEMHNALVNKYKETE